MVTLFGPYHGIDQLGGNPPTPLVIQMRRKFLVSKVDYQSRVNQQQRAHSRHTRNSLEKMRNKYESENVQQIDIRQALMVEM